MGEYIKKQHFIPRAAILRRFSDLRSEDDNLNRLMVYDKTMKTTRESCVYHEAFENYLYEEPSFPQNEIENALAAEESEWVVFIDKIEKICMNTASQKASILYGQLDEDMIKQIIIAQYFRTSAVKKAICDMPEEYSNPKRTFASMLYYISKDVEKWKIQHREDLEHLFVWFERNRTNIPFLLADTVVDVVGKEGVENSFVYRMPITPVIQVFLFDDRNTYVKRVYGFRNRLVDSIDKNDVLHWNQCSYNSANRFIYYSPGQNFNFIENDPAFLQLES